MKKINLLVTFALSTVYRNHFIENLIYFYLTLNFTFIQQLSELLPRHPGNIQQVVSSLVSVLEQLNV